MNNPPNLQLEVGELKGLIKALTEAIREERRATAEERRYSSMKVDRIEDRIGQLEFLFDPLIKNSKKHDRAIGELKLVYTKVAAVIGFFSTMGGIIISGLWYILTHWDEIFTTTRQILGGWK